MKARIMTDLSLYEAKEIKARMLREHAGYYARYVRAGFFFQKKGEIVTPLLDGVGTLAPSIEKKDAFIERILNESSDSRLFGWETCNGNKLTVTIEEDGVVFLEVEGARHGIPWYFLCPREEEEYSVYMEKKEDFLRLRINPYWEVIEMTSRIDLAPWFATSDGYGCVTEDIEEYSML